MSSKSIRRMICNFLSNLHGDRALVTYTRFWEFCARWLLMLAHTAFYQDYWRSPYRLRTHVYFICQICAIPVKLGLFLFLVTGTSQAVQECVLISGASTKLSLRLPRHTLLPEHTFPWSLHGAAGLSAVQQCHMCKSQLFLVGWLNYFSHYPANCSYTEESSCQSHAHSTGYRMTGAARIALTEIQY